MSTAAKRGQRRDGEKRTGAERVGQRVPRSTCKARSPGTAASLGWGGVLLRTAWGMGWDHGRDSDGLWEGTTERKNTGLFSATLWRMVHTNSYPGAPEFGADGVAVVWGWVKSRRMPGESPPASCCLEGAGAASCERASARTWAHDRCVCVCTHTHLPWVSLNLHQCSSTLFSLYPTKEPF